MAQCKDCIHYEICDEYVSPCESFPEVDGCKCFLNKADIVPKSEVEKLQAEIKVLTENSITSKYPCCVSCSRGLILTKSLEEYDELLADIANEVAREIFEEIEDVLNNIGYFDEIDFKALKKKYTESGDKE